MKILLLILYLNFSDTLKIEYQDSLNSIEWKQGYIVTDAIKMGISIYYTEPDTWLDINKNPIIKPKRYYIK